MEAGLPVVAGAARGIRAVVADTWKHYTSLGTFKGVPICSKPKGDWPHEGNMVPSCSVTVFG